MKRVLLIAVSLLIFGFSANVQAGIVASWDMYGEPGDQVYTPGIDSANVAAFDMVRGAGLSPNIGSNSLNSKGWDGTDAGDYLEFGFSVDAGYSVTLDELWIGTRSSNTGPGTIGVYTSLDNFGSSIYTITQSGTDYSNSIIDLNGIDPINGDFYLRLYEIGDTQADGSGATASTGTFRIVDHYDSGTYTDVQFTGTTSAVPVPAALWLLCSGLIALIGIRKTRI